VLKADNYTKKQAVTYLKRHFPEPLAGPVAPPKSATESLINADASDGERKVEIQRAIGVCVEGYQGVWGSDVA